MTGNDVLASLARDGVTLYLDDAGELRARSRPGALTPEMRATIAAHRPALVAALADEAIIAGTLANLAAESQETREAWRREVVVWQRWEEAGGTPDPNQRLDLAALRRLLPPGTCLDCGASMSDDGHRWCARCERATTTAAPPKERDDVHGLSRQTA